MKNRTILRAALLVFGGFATGSVTAYAQSWYVFSPYYSLPAWSQKLPAAGRFQILADWDSEAVLDKETGLVWQRSPGTMQPNKNNQLNALAICEQNRNGGRFGWRLPFIHELSSLLDPTVIGSGPFLPSGHPFTIAGAAGDSVYWSATSAPGDPNSAMIGVFFGSASVGLAPKTNLYYIWCVRGGSSARP